MDRGVFFWPSKVPGFSNQPHPEQSAVREGRFSEVAIEFFIQSGRTGEMYPEIIEEAKRRDNIAKWETLRPGLDRITRKRDPGGHTELYLATEVLTPSGVPALLSCDSSPQGACTMGFTWRGLRVYVRFDGRHGKDWPEISAEILHVLAQVREV